MLIIREAFLRTRRFDDFQRNVGASRNIVAGRLRKLVDEGILERRRYEERPPRYEYRLTEKGLALYPVLTSLLAWGDRWMADEKGPPLQILHTDCGHPTVPRLTCDHCGEVIDPRRVGVRRRALAARDDAQN